jgi:peptidoglycan/LPS O-acetylase OafA/YrhL
MISKSANRVDDAREGLLRPVMPELDTIRGIAVLAVVFFHEFFFIYRLNGLSGLPKVLVAATAPGWVGVNLFFVLSGFLITGILLDTKKRPDYFRRFYTRRALRILPLYYAVLILLALLSWTGLVDRRVGWGFLTLSFFYLSNVTQLFGIPMQYGVLWSLAVEEHFYLLWPTLVRRVSRRGVILAATAICIVCAALRMLYAARGYSMGSGYTWLVADGLAMGAILAGIARSPERARARVGYAGAVAFSSSVAMFAVGAPFGIFLASRFLGLALRDTALDLFCVGIVASVLMIGTSPWKALVNRPTLQFFGKISYGVYLIHMLIFEVTDHILARLAPGLPPGKGHFGSMVVRFFAGFVLTIGVASLSRWYFEEPFLRLKGRFEKKPLVTDEPESVSAVKAGADGDMQAVAPSA